MLSKIRRSLTFANVMSSIAVFLALTTGTAYAVNEWTGANIVNGSLTTADYLNNDIRGADILDGTILGVDVGPSTLDGTHIVNGSVGTGDVTNNDLRSADIKNGEILGADVAAETLTGANILDGSVSGADVTDGTIDGNDVSQLDGDADIIDNTITTFDIATNAIDSDEVLDFGLSNEDVGVLFAQVNADHTVANSSGGVSTINLGTGTVEIDFGRDISSCAFVGTQGEAGIGGAAGAIVGLTDRSGNANAIFATTRDAAGALINTALQVLVVC
jgi:hypothetical protein